MFIVITICINNFFFVFSDYIKEVFKLNLCMMYSIVEFEDGLQVVPGNWKIDEKSCLWPPVTDQIKLNNMVADRAEPQSSWRTFFIIKNYGKAGKYLIS